MVMASSLFLPLQDDLKVKDILSRVPHKKRFNCIYPLAKDKKICNGKGPLDKKFDVNTKEDDTKMVIIIIIMVDILIFL